MEFAKNQLAKYGWKEGEGLGKNKDGQAAPIKTCMKLNSHGIGYNAGKEFSNNWWERVFNEAANNIVAVKDSEGAVTKIEVSKSVDITTKRKPKEDDLTYGTFKKKSRLKGQDVEPIEKFSSSSSDDDTAETIDDDKLFRICGGRTGHKGSRHGLTLSGKLARLEQQEKQLLSKALPHGPTLASNLEENEVKRKKKKTKKYTTIK